MDISTALAKLFSHAHSVGLRGIIQFNFSQEETFWVNIGEHSTIAHGRHENADTCIDIRKDDFFRILTGNVDIEQLFAAGNIKISGDLGLATLLPQIVDSVLNTGISQKPLDTIELNGRYPAPARHSEAISSCQLPLASIERKERKKLSLDEFRTHYVSAGIPLVITDALYDWPIFSMTREDSLSYFENLTGLTRHGDYVSNTFSTKRDFRTVSMSDFINSLDDERKEKNNPDDMPVYMGNNIVPTQLLDQIRFPAYFPKNLFIPPRIWIGPRGTLTPLHRDDSDNLFAQVWGEKLFTLAPPHHREALGTWSTSPQGGLEGCDFNPDAPDYEKFPLARDVSLLRFTLEAGDMLFLPEGWFHQVESISTSLSVNFWINSGRG